MANQGIIVGHVISKDGKREYEQRKIRVGEWTCTCKSFQYAKQNDKGRKFPCRHLQALWKAVKSEVVPVNIKINARTLEAFNR